MGCRACRYGYSSVQMLQRVVDSYAYYQIPLETVVTDTQYMLADQDFTISPDFQPLNVRTTSCLRSGKPCEDGITALYLQVSTSNQ